MRDCFCLRLHRMIDVSCPGATTRPAGEGWRKPAIQQRLRRLGSGAARRSHLVFSGQQARA
jgi:hypothetical protein